MHSLDPCMSSGSKVYYSRVRDLRTSSIACLIFLFRDWILSMNWLARSLDDFPAVWAGSYGWITACCCDSSRLFISGVTHSSCRHQPLIIPSPWFVYSNPLLRCQPSYYSIFLIILLDLLTSAIAHHQLLPTTSSRNDDNKQQQS